jgi:glycosyltransferase involved in cell wall biosynthesis
MVGVFTLTRDRLAYTRACFHSLRAKSGRSFLHCVVDNGSTDGTKQWLRSQYRPHMFLDLPQNVGISKGCNLALQAIRQFWDVDLIVKFDNDCLVQTDRVLTRILASVNVVRRFFPLFVLSPRVTGIIHQPKRLKTLHIENVRVGCTSIVGGLFHSVPAYLYSAYRYPETLPPARGQDEHFCAWVLKSGGICGYLEDLEVEHIESTAVQARRYPRYFHRKHLEEVKALA